ncbi:MAG: hypothetical protein QNI88_16655, partial [Desulfobacterales bacterium]|nr:hypothetical protein [Desulfobacterales bacterium]
RQFLQLYSRGWRFFSSWNRLFDALSRRQGGDAHRRKDGPEIAVNSSMDDDRSIYFLNRHRRG